MLPFDKLMDEEKDYYYAKAIEILSLHDLLYCSRDYNDFHSASEDDNIVYDVAEKLYNIVFFKVRKEKIKILFDNE